MEDGGRTQTRRRGEPMTALLSFFFVLFTSFLKQRQTDDDDWRTSSPLLPSSLPLVSLFVSFILSPSLNLSVSFFSL